MRRLLIATLSATLSAILIACGSGPSRQEIQKDMVKADVAWGNGDSKTAVGTYRTLYGAQRTTKEEKKRILPRIVEAELEESGPDGAKEWIRRGLEDKLDVEYATDAANVLLAEAKAEHEKAEAARKAEKERQARADALAERRANPVSVEQYHRVVTGMHVKEVAEIIPHGGEEVSRVEIGGVTTVMCVWTNRSGGSMSITFQDWKVVAKAQHGLR